MSHVDDPIPLNPAQNLTAANILKDVPDQRFAVLIQINRFWRPSVLNCVLPVVLVAILSLFIFFLGR